MIHKMRWTAEKIAQRLRVIEPLVYRRAQALPPLRYKALAGPMEPPPLGLDLALDDWPVLQPHSYWGAWTTDFLLRTTFAVPADWDPPAPVALYLPLGEAGDFTTAPEISQMFGEMLGLWCVAMWRRMGAPAPVLLVELGPGRGTLMADALRAARTDSRFLDAMRLHLVETSPAL